MDDRELIAAVFDPYYWTGDFTPGNSIERDCIDYLNEKRVSSLAKADAVLAALGDRLLPELPEWVAEGEWETDGEGVTVMLYGDSYWRDEHLYWRKSPTGTGPTLAAAIRDAVGEAEREGDDAQG